MPVYFPRIQSVDDLSDNLSFGVPECDPRLVSLDEGSRGIDLAGNGLQKNWIAEPAIRE